MAQLDWLHNCERNHLCGYVDPCAQKSNMQIFLQKVYLDLNTSYVNLIWELQVQRGSSE